MPIVTIQMYPGRTEAQKRSLILAIYDAMVEHAHADRNRVSVVIEEIPRENWGVGGLWAPDRTSGAEAST